MADIVEFVRIAPARGVSESFLFSHSMALAESGDSFLSHRIIVRFVTPNSAANSFIVSFARFLARLNRPPSVSLMRLFLARKELTSRWSSAVFLKSLWVIDSSSRIMHTLLQTLSSSSPSSLFIMIVYKCLARSTISSPAVLPPAPCDHGPAGPHVPQLPGSISRRCPWPHDVQGTTCEPGLTMMRLQ